MIFVVQGEEKERKKITGVSGFGFRFVHKRPFCDGYLFFRNWFAETANFKVFVGSALIGPSCQKERNFGTPQNKNRKL